MERLDLPPFFESLHRPYHQPLKASRLVCDFIYKSKNKIKGSELNYEFYFYLIIRVYKNYIENPGVENPGYTSMAAIVSIVNHFKKFNRSQKFEELTRILHKDRTEDIEKQVYSSYKAASYYINLAKDKLGLVTNKNMLSPFGLELLNIKTKNHLIELTINEKIFFFRRLTENDFLLLVSLCLFKRLEYKYKLTDSENRYYDFIAKMYKIRHFEYNRKSLINYNKVRNVWIDSLDLLNSRQIIKNVYLEIINKNEVHLNWYTTICEKFKLYENENFKDSRSYEGLSKKFEINYKQALKDNKGVLGFVNIYDIKSDIKISFKNFNTFLNSFYENEKGRKHIFFSNIVSSIDRRKRFIVRGIPVLKIKFKI